MQKSSFDFNSYSSGSDQLNTLISAIDKALARLMIGMDYVHPRPLQETMSVGRDGASDAVSFLRVGVPAVEFGPVGAGHHGPAEWVSVSSLQAYRQALESFLRAIPDQLDD